MVKLFIVIQDSPIPKESETHVRNFRFLAYTQEGNA